MATNNAINNQLFSTAVSIASNPTTSIGAAGTMYLTITGTTTITAFDNIAAGQLRYVRFSGALTLTHNATSLILPNNGSNITTADGDTAIFVSEGSGNWRCLMYTPVSGSAPAGGGVTGFTGSQNTSSPNNTVNASRLLVSASSTNADFVIQAKGTGAIVAQLPDNTATGGNKRGANAVDLQTVRGSASQVASGARSIVLGENSTASGTNSVAIGLNSSATNTFAIAIGGTASGSSAIAIGGTASGSSAIAISGTASGVSAIALGSTASGDYSTSAGYISQSAKDASFAIGHRALAYINNQFAIGSTSTSGSIPAGNSQTSIVTLRADTTNATPTSLTASAASGISTSEPLCVVRRNFATHFLAKIIAFNKITGNSASFMRDGLIKNIENTTTLIGSIGTIGTDRSDASMSSCSISITANDTNETLDVVVTGIASTQIRWVCTLLFTEVGIG